MPSIPAQIILTYSASNVRLFFRIYFIVLGTIAAPLGQACSAAAIKLKLAKGKNVKLTEMLGWLGGLDTLLSLWKLRAFPSGPTLTFFMLLTYLVGLASDLVGAYIRTVDVRDQCTFGTGLVLSSSQASMAHPPWNGYPYSVIQQAFAFSLANDGLQGIYTKVNEDKSFSAVQDDVLGTWRCTQNSLELDYPINESVYDMTVDLVKHDLLYNVNTVAPAASYGNTSTEHITLLDTSNIGTNGEAWDVRACISTYNTESNTNTMLSFQCTLNDSAGWLTDVLKDIDTGTTMAAWSLTIQGSCYSGTGTPARSNLGTILEREFNTMVMIANGHNYLLNSSESSSTQGCLTSRTWILWEVVGLAVLAALINMLLLAYFVILKLLQMKYSMQEHYSMTTEAPVKVRKGLKSVPGDFLQWTSQAVEESLLGDRTRMHDEKLVEPKELRRRRFGWRDADNRFGILKDVRHSEEVSLLVQRPK